MHKFKYALRFPNGLYYTGRVNSTAEPNAWQGKVHQAFTYSEYGAHAKQQRFDCFSECTVERIL